MAWYLTAKSQSFVAGDPSSGAGAMTEWVKDLLCRHEGPLSDPQLVKPSYCAPCAARDPDIENTVEDDG